MRTPGTSSFWPCPPMASCSQPAPDRVRRGSGTSRPGRSFRSSTPSASATSRGAGRAIGWRSRCTTRPATRVVVVDRSGAELARFDEEPGYFIPSVSLSPDGRLVAMTREGERFDPTLTTRIWDWQRDEIVATIDTGGPALNAVFDPTGTRIVTSGRQQGQAAVWDVQTGERLATLTDPPAFFAVTFSPDGRTIATAHRDGTVRLWDAGSGAQRLVLRGHEGAALSLAFSPDGSKLASAGDDGLVRVWALDLDDLIGIATDRLTRSFSDEECRQYLHLDGCAAP